MSIGIRWALVLLLPFLTCGLQWLLWDAWIKPLTWFLFYPAAFFGAALLGTRGGLACGVIGSLLGWFVFMPPAFTASLDKRGMFSLVMFLAMAILFGWVFDRVTQAQGLTAEALGAAESERRKSHELADLLREREQNREALSESENRFAATFEQAAVGIALVGPDGRWLRVNRRLCAIVGYEPEELMTKSFQDITHPEDLEADLGEVNRMLRREISTYSMEKRYIRKDGRIVWINLTVSLVWGSSGQPDYFISVIEDIDQRKQAEAEVKARNRELERFNQASIDRELQMIGLKREVNRLSQEAGRPPPYDLSFAPDEDGGTRA